MLWYCKNITTFEGKDNAHSFLLCRVIKLASDYNHQLNLKLAAKSRSLVIKQIAQTPPPQHWIKINTDGSLLSDSGSAACGGIGKNHEGSFVAAWSINLGSCTITNTERWAVLG